MNRVKLTLLAAISIALAFTFSCSGNGNNDEQSFIDSSSSSEFSSSSVSSSSEWLSSSSEVLSSSSSVGESSSSSEEPSSSSMEEPSSSSSLPLCGTTSYDPETHYCHDNQTYSCGNLPYNPLTLFCDARDGKAYKWVKIGTQTWMAENLNFNATGSKCGNVLTGNGSLVDGNTTTCDTYGRLYNWATAMAGAESSDATPSGVQGVCPAGWHLPSDGEWDVLMTAVGGDATAGTKLKSEEGWNTGSGYIPGTDDYGFAALPSGNGHSFVNFANVGDSGFWWSTSQFSAINAYYRYVNYYRENVYWDYYNKNLLFSLRCLQD